MMDAPDAISDQLRMLALIIARLFEANAEGGYRLLTALLCVPSYGTAIDTTAKEDTERYIAHQSALCGGAQNIVQSCKRMRFGDPLGGEVDGPVRLIAHNASLTHQDAMTWFQFAYSLYDAERSGNVLEGKVLVQRGEVDLLPDRWMGKHRFQFAAEHESAIGLRVVQGFCA